MDVLVALGSSAAYFYSLGFTSIAVLSAGKQAEGKQCFETSAMLITFILFGKYLESMARGKASEAMSKLLTLQPPTALRCSGCWDGQPQPPRAAADADLRVPAAPPAPPAEPVEVAVSSLTKGDVIKVMPGSQVPLDSVVLHGSSAVDESMLTGEAMPVPKAKGDKLVGGTMNCGGVLWALVSAAAEDSTLAQIAAVVADAQHRRPQVQAFADRVSTYFVPIVVALALTTYTVWTLADVTGVLPRMYVTHCGLEDAQLFAFMFGCAVLVVACPCALGLATPTAVMVGGGVASRHGILVKGGDVLESASTVDTVLFDKTGTLTTGSLHVAAISRLGLARCETDDDLLGIAASAERGSEHLIARAIAAHAAATGTPVVEPERSLASPGHGISCLVRGVPTLVGTRAWLTAHAVHLSVEQVSSC